MSSSPNSSPRPRSKTRSQRLRAKMAGTVIDFQVGDLLQVLRSCWPDARSLWKSLMPMKLSLLPCCLIGLAGLLLSSCQLPPEARYSSSGALCLDSPFGVLKSAGGGSLFSGAQELNVPHRSGAINEVARMLAGLPGSSAPAFHQQQMQALWQRHEHSRGQKVRAWAATEIGGSARVRAAYFIPLAGRTISLRMSFSRRQTPTSCAV
jgi:hypothetical protein